MSFVRSVDPLHRSLAVRLSAWFALIFVVASAGLFGLMDAINGFDLSRGIKFKTYCSTRIRGSILDELRSQDWVPRLVRLKAHRLDRAIRQLEGELGRAVRLKPKAERRTPRVQQQAIACACMFDAVAIGIQGLACRRLARQALPVDEGRAILVQAHLADAIADPAAIAVRPALVVARAVVAGNELGALAGGDADRHGLEEARGLGVRVVGRRRAQLGGCIRSALGRRHAGGRTPRTACADSHAQHTKHGEAEPRAAGLHCKRSRWHPQASWGSAADASCAAAAFRAAPARHTYADEATGARRLASSRSTA